MLWYRTLDYWMVVCGLLQSKTTGMQSRTTSPPKLVPVQQTIWLEQESWPTPITVTGEHVRPIGLPSGITPSKARIVEPAVDELEMTESQQ